MRFLQVLVSHCQNIANVVLYSGYSSNAYSTVDRYRSPVSGNSVTIRLPRFSGRRASWVAPNTAAPELMPTSSPYSAASCLPVRMASSLLTVSTSSTISALYVLGTKPAPMP